MEPPENAEQSADHDEPNRAGGELVSYEPPADENPAEVVLSAENEAVPESPLPIRATPLGHQQRFQNMTFLTIAGLVAVVALSTLIVSAVAPATAPLAGDIAKYLLPSLVTLLGAAITWAFRSGGH